MLTGTIRNQIDQVWTLFWTGGVANPISVIEQISYLLFIRRLDEIQRGQERRARRDKRFTYKAVFSQKEAEFRWNSFKYADPDKMLEIVRDKVFPKIKTLQDQGSFAEHMKDAIFMIPTAKLLSQVVDLLDQIDMDDKDTKGDLYEYLLSKLQQAGVNGQFRTPRNITQMIANLMRPRIDDTICDPSSGTCGFLMSALEYVEEHHKALLEDADLVKHRHHFQDAMFTGYDFDKHMLRIGAMNMLLHGIENPVVEYRDSLQDRGDNNIRDAFSLILANPPFKGSVDFDIIAPDLLSALGKTTTKKKPKVEDTKLDENGSTIAPKEKKGPTEKSELLFIALILRMLKIGGRAAVIVPDGVLFGSTQSHKKIRQELLEKQKLEAVISLPSGVFKPYAGVSTAILIFTKTNTGGTEKVWFYDMLADGYSLDDKRTPLFKVDETPTHEQSNVADIIARFHSLSDEKGLPNLASEEYARTKDEQSFMVSLEDIKADQELKLLEDVKAEDKKAFEQTNAKRIAEGKKPLKEKEKSYITITQDDGKEYVIVKESNYDLSINRYKQVVYDTVVYEEPKVILARINKLQEKMAASLKDLEAML